MPNIKAAQKWMRQTEKRTQRNKETKSRLRTLYKKGISGEIEPAKVDSAYDKAASKGAIHPNKAARKKSRLAKALKRAEPSRVDAERPK